MKFSRFVLLLTTREINFGNEKKTVYVEDCNRSSAQAIRKCLPFRRCSICAQWMNEWMLVSDFHCKYLSNILNQIISDFFSLVLSTNPDLFDASVLVFSVAERSISMKVLFSLVFIWFQIWLCASAIFIQSAHTYIYAILYNGFVPFFLSCPFACGTFYHSRHITTEKKDRTKRKSYRQNAAFYAGFYALGI